MTTSPHEPLPDVWFTRDLPVLRAIARLVDSSEHGNSPYLLGAVVPASGLPKAEVVAAARAQVWSRPQSPPRRSAFLQGPAASVRVAGGQGGPLQSREPVDSGRTARILSPGPVRNNASNVLAKLQVTDRAQAIVQAREAGPRR